MRHIPVTVLAFVAAVAPPCLVHAACTLPPGDFTGDGVADVTDVQCEILATLAELQGGAAPACLAAPPVADADCSGAADVVDVTLGIDWVLGLPVASDADADGCVDACQANCGDGVCQAGIENCVGCPSDCPCAPGACTGAGLCTCVPQCASKACGPDGCGGTCGTCPVGTSCVSGQCKPSYGQSCPQVAPPAPVPLRPLPDVDPPGSVETVQSGSFTDDRLASSDGAIAIATRRQWGSSIVYFGMVSAGPSGNVIDAHDTGREVQVALYDPARSMQGCAWNATCASNPAGACPSSITFLGWDPVQGGNECGVGSTTELVESGPGWLRAVVRPRFWNPDWQKSDCSNGGCGDPALKGLVSDVRYTQRLRFVAPRIVEMEMTVENLSNIDHAPTTQEFPTLYASYGAGGTPNLHVILNSEGNVIPVDDPANDGFFNAPISSPGAWVALENDNLDYGVGIYYEARLTQFQAWQKNGVFNNVRAVFTFGLPAGGTVFARAYLLLGAYSTIASDVAWLDSHLAPFGVLDTPGADQVVSGPLPVAGWVLDNKGVDVVRVLVDGVEAASGPPNTSRPDVCAMYPGYAMCDQVGYSFVLDGAGLAPCAHLIEVEAVDTDGNARVIARRRIYAGSGPPECSVATDCDDGDPCTVDGCQSGACTHGAVPPGSGPAEACNGVDDDCDGQTDEGGVCDTIHPVYRFYWGSGGNADHAFGLSPAPPPGYQFEGIGFYLYDNPAPDRAALYQSYCGACKDHMPTRMAAEGAPAYADPVLLGYVATSPSSGAPAELRRVYHPTAADHFATRDPGEVAGAQALGYQVENSLGWVPTP